MSAASAGASRDRRRGIGEPAEPDPDRVLTAVEAHQAVLDAEWTDPGASTGGPSPMPAETTIRDRRDDLIRLGPPVISAASDVRRVKAVVQDDGTVTARTEVRTTMTYGDSPEVTGSETHRHTLTLIGSDADGYSVTQDAMEQDEPRGSPPDGIQLRADLVALAVTVVFAGVALLGAVLPWLGRSRATSAASRLWFGAGSTLAVACTWMSTMDNSMTDDEFGDGGAACLRGRLDSLDPGLDPYLSHDCVAHSRIGVLLALAVAVTIVLAEYRVLLGLRARAEGREPYDDGSATAPVAPRRTT